MPGDRFCSHSDAIARHDSPRLLFGGTRERMTTLQLHLFNCLYLAVLVAVGFLTRATARRIAGALAGGLTFGVVALGIIALGEEVGWGHMAITWEPYFVTLLLAGFSLGAFI